MSEEDTILPIPNLEVAQQLFVLSNPSLSRLHDEARTKLVEGIKADNMAPYYRTLSSSSSIKLDQSLLSTMEEANKSELAKLDDRLEQAHKTEGESEIGDALRARAAYFTKIGDREQSQKALEVALEKTPGLGSRIDIVLTLVRVGLFFGDNELITSNLSKADKLITEGGDWDRLNRLKAYRAIHLLSLRAFSTAFPLFTDALPTFTATELCSYDQFVAYAILTGVVVGGRSESTSKNKNDKKTVNEGGRAAIRKRILEAPEVRAVVNGGEKKYEVHGELAKSLYECRYADFFKALAEVEHDVLLAERWLAPHARYYVRECRILAYAQHLESYRSLTLGSLAHAFGVSETFIDNELSRFIANGRLHCTIDKVHGVVSTVRPGTGSNDNTSTYAPTYSAKYAQYETVVKKGDALLGKVQRLSKVLY